MGKPITPEELAGRVDGAYGDMCDLIEMLTLKYDDVVADFDGEAATKVRELSRHLGMYVNPTVLFIFMASAIGDLIEELVEGPNVEGKTPADYVARIRSDAANEVRDAQAVINEPPDGKGCV